MRRESLSTGSRPGCRHAALAALASAILLSATPAGAAPAGDEPEPMRIRDLDFGDVLFHFYQDDYFGALVRLEAAHDLGRMPHHDAEAALLSGGLYLSLGMHAEATRIFDSLLAGSVPASVRNRARFYLARIDWQHGSNVDALRNLSLIQGTLPDGLESERHLLEANILMASGRYGDAARVLETANPDDAWAPYARYNLGIALVRSGRIADGAGWLAAVGTAQASTEEQHSLRDRANLALGYAMLQQRAAGPASVALERVRLDGPYTNRALLGLGWAESDARHPDQALVPWLELRDGRLLDAAVQESYLAVPYAYAQLASNGQAVAQYRYAVQAYATESRRLDESIAAIRAGGFLDKVLAAAPQGDPIGWRWQLRRIPDAPETRYLYHLLATHAFQEGLRNYRDLRLMQRNLAGWSDSLAAFDDMVATRELASAQRQPERDALLGRTDLDAMAARQAALEVRVAAVAADRDVAAVATPEEAASWNGIAAAEARIGALPPGPERDALEERARLLRGVMLWQLDAAWRARILGLKSDLRDTKDLLAEAHRRVGAVETADAQAPQDTAGFAGRIDGLAARVDALRPRIDAASAAQERALAALAINELEAQKRRLASYAGQAQFALASLYDGATAGVVK